MSDKVGTHTGKIVPCFFDILLAYRNGHIFVLHDGICSCCLIKQHLVVFLTQLLYSVKLHCLRLGFFSNLFNSASVYVSIGCLSSFANSILNVGRYSHFIKKYINVFKSLAYVQGFFEELINSIGYDEIEKIFVIKASSEKLERSIRENIY